MTPVNDEAAMNRNSILKLPSEKTAGHFVEDDAKKNQANEGPINPVSALLKLCNEDADKQTLFAAMNRTYAVTKYGTKIVVANIFGKDMEIMDVAEFHKMFANMVTYDGDKAIKVSKAWFAWKDRRQYLGRGIVFEPGGPLDIPDDMLNLWRGFGVEPKQGDWSLMHNHILNVICAGNQAHVDYLLNWMAYAVQHPAEPIGVAVALLGPQGAGKGIFARTFCELFGDHFAHIANGEQLTGRFNAKLATSCAVFLDEALWAGDKKGEGVLKALITEPKLQMEAKFRDPIMVDNRLRIMVASNNDWTVPVGIGDRRWFILKVADTYAGTEHPDYWKPLYAEVVNGGAAAMFHDLLAKDLSGFDVRAVPHTAAKAQQQTLSLHGTPAWLHHALHEGAVGAGNWGNTGLEVPTKIAYEDYVEYSKQQRDYRPDGKSQWSRTIHRLLGRCVEKKRGTTGDRPRLFKFAPLVDCRREFARRLGAPDLEWDDPNNEPQSDTGMRGSPQTDKEDVNKLLRDIGRTCALVREES
jgi:hypothetical protein